MATSPSLLPAPEEAPLTPTVITALITTTAGFVPILLHPASQLMLPNIPLSAACAHSRVLSYPPPAFKNQVQSPRCHPRPLSHPHSCLVCCSWSSFHLSLSHSFPADTLPHALGSCLLPVKADSDTSGKALKVLSLCFHCAVLTSSLTSSTGLP